MLYNIIADATSISDSEVIKIKKLDNIVALDGVSNQLLANGIFPSAVVGDLDSISATSLQKLVELGIPVHKMYDQNKTDLEKGIHFCDSRQASAIDIYNAFGERIDHSLFNLRVLKSHHSTSRTLRLCNQFEYAKYMRDCIVKISGPKGAQVALISFPDAEVTSSGLLYDMERYSLKFATNESICNSLAKERAEITIVRDVLLTLSNQITIDAIEHC